MSSDRKPLKQRTMRAAIASAVGAAFVVLGPTIALGADEEDLTTLADRLIKLRGEVETLHDDIESKQQQHRNRMASLSQRRAELESQIQREELQYKKLQRQVDEVNAKAKTIDEASMALRPVVKTVSSLLEQHVAAALPFTIGERSAELKQVRAKLERNELSVPRAINQMWTFVEDELRLCRENGIFRQTILLDGDEQLADVIRLGMTMLFFRTDDGEVVGRAVKTNDIWAFQPLTGEPAAVANNLFGEFERQVRTGFFRIPNALPGESK
ncbi:MAG: DUF3450 family protein [Myxococcota bacterium]